LAEIFQNSPLPNVNSFMLCYAMTISWIKTHYLRCPPVSTIHPLKGPLVLPPEESGAFRLDALQWSFLPRQSQHAVSLINRWWAHPVSRTTGLVSLSRQEIVPMSSPALKSIYGSVVYLFGYTTFPDLRLQARCRRSALPPASRSDSPALPVVSHAHDL
jgi:hypothetical protein